MNKNIEVDYISNSTAGVTVHFNNGAVQLFDYTMQPLSGVIFNERELKAERFTAKYNTALQTYLDERTDAIENENKNGVTHYVYIVGKIVTAQKFQGEKMVQVYDWTNHFPNTERLKESMSDSFHQTYIFIEVADVEEIALGKAFETVEQIQAIEGWQADQTAIVNLTASLQRYYKQFDTAFLYHVTLDKSQSLHFIFEVVKDYTSTYQVHSAYFNGLAERTTYNGLHRGVYDVSFPNLRYWIDRRKEGFHGSIGFNV